MQKETVQKTLHVRESNPGRLRDRQKCYQLHQRGHAITERGFVFNCVCGGFVDLVEYDLACKLYVLRSHHSETTASHSNCEVKHCWAELVLQWGTMRESSVS